MEQAKYDNQNGKLPSDSHIYESQTNRTCLPSFHDMLFSLPPCHDKGSVLGDNGCSIDSLQNNMHVDSFISQSDTNE